MKIILFLCIVTLTLAGCSKRDWADTGYNDGYAVGYNTECKIRATLIEGKWDNKQYADAYRSGYADGAADCRQRGDD